MQYKNTKPTVKVEFIILMALLMSLAALAIDTMMPALSIIRKEFDIENINEGQKIIAYLFLGLSIGQLFHGPLSDSYGRKPVLTFGIILFILGSLLCIFAPNFNILLVGRVIQGLGVASTRIITIAIIRDQYSGREMAKIMSLIMMVFIVIPAVAPSIGMVILKFSNWKMIFVLFIILAMSSLIWFILRQVETLTKEHRKKLSLANLYRSFVIVATNSISRSYTIISGLIFGAFISYLMTAQQIFQIHYNLGEHFPLYFGSLAVCIGISSYYNSKLVFRIGMKKLCFAALVVILINSIVFLAIIEFITPNLSLTVYMIFLVISFFSIGILFGNLNTLAIEPHGEIAGMATAIISSIQTFISIICATFIGNHYINSVTPLIIGFGVLSFLSVILMIYQERDYLK